MISIIKAKLTLLQVQIKTIFMKTTKLHQPGLSKSPKVFNTINMATSF